MPPEIKPSEQPPAVAYVRLGDDADPDAFAVCLQDIAACCQREGLHLTRTFTDRGYDGRELARPGIIELQQALKDHAGLAVVVPTLDHLSPAEVIRRVLVLVIRNLDGRVVVANKAAGSNGTESGAAEREPDSGRGDTP